MLFILKTFPAAVLTPFAIASSKQGRVLNGSTSMHSLEVEEKFSLMNRNMEDLEVRLRKLGFAKTADKTMVDWYHDTPAYSLLQQDCWLRCRETGTTRQWQLKRGAQNGHGSTGATVYEEIEGDSAVEVASSLLSQLDSPSEPNDSPPEPIRSGMCCQENSNPELPFPNSGFVPFARIFTQRSSWTEESDARQLFGLSVDLDSTDFGYAVGEVESVVDDTSQIENVRKHIRDLIQKIGDAPTSDTKAVGKLEFYLQKNRPEVYKICVDSGVL